MVDANLQPLQTLTGFICGHPRLRDELPRLYFGPPQLPNFDFDVDPGFHFDRDQDPASQNDVDPCGSDSDYVTLIETL